MRPVFRGCLYSNYTKWFTSGFQIRQGMQQNIIPVPTSKLPFKVQFFAATYFRVFKSFAKIAKIRSSRKFPLIRYPAYLQRQIGGQDFIEDGVSGLEAVPRAGRDCELVSPRWASILLCCTAELVVNSVTYRHKFHKNSQTTHTSKLIVNSVTYRCNFNKNSQMTHSLTPASLSKLF